MTRVALGLYADQVLEVVTQRGLTLPNGNRTGQALAAELPTGSPKPNFLDRQHTEKTASAKIELMSSLS